MPFDNYDCYCDYEQPEWLTVRKIKAARKAHRCGECGVLIPKGSPYEYVCGKWDGVIDIFHTCALCVELREWAKISVPCFCWAYGNVHQDVRDMVDNVRSDGPPGFYFEYGRRIVKINRTRNISKGG